jgi:hypothetical protein
MLYEPSCCPQGESTRLLVCFPNILWGGLRRRVARAVQASPTSAHIYPVHLIEPTGCTSRLTVYTSMHMHHAYLHDSSIGPPFPPLSLYSARLNLNATS